MVESRDVKLLMTEYRKWLVRKNLKNTSSKKGLKKANRAYLEFVDVWKGEPEHYRKVYVHISRSGWSSPDDVRMGAYQGGYVPCDMAIFFKCDV